MSGGPVAFRSDAVDTNRASDPFSTQALERIRLEVIHELGRGGYCSASVDASFSLTEDGTHADCVLHVTPGPQVRVRKIVPVGNKRTLDDLILSQATMSEGLPLDIDSLYSTQNNLLALGIFKLVEVEVPSAETPEALKTVLLKVREQPRVPEFGVGYFVAEGPRDFADISVPNLWGRAINLSGHIQLNAFLDSVPVLSRQVDVSALPAWKQLGGRGNISVQNRGLLPFQIGMRVDLVGERVFRSQFNFTRFALVPSLDWSKAFEIPRLGWVHPKITLLLQDEVEWASAAHERYVQSCDSAIIFSTKNGYRFLS